MDVKQYFQRHYSESVVAPKKKRKGQKFLKKQTNMAKLQLVVIMYNPEKDAEVMQNFSIVPYWLYCPISSIPINFQENMQKYRRNEHRVMDK